MVKGIPQSQNNHHESFPENQPTPEYETTPEHQSPRSGSKVREITADVEQINHILAEELSAPNTVLALAGLKGGTHIFGLQPTEEMIQAIKDTNIALEDYGIMLSHLIDDDQELAIIVISLLGIEDTIQHNQIPGVPHFSAGTGFRGFYQWRRALNPSLAEAQADGLIPSEVDIEQYEVGILLGYPSQAIIDFEEALRHDAYDVLQASGIITEGIPYRGALPEFDFYPEHANHPEIAGYIKECRRVLVEFYAKEE